ncbi:hypothetical protein KIF24_17090 [Micromonospora sp. Llam7]|uniref:hypothetical protein n=1 Tax=Micromonospora tarapacensis TaxID=2835305 RepID=UPI001C8397B9|nr:hypothetical protein [Micromonospora tarapacensis]MBX7267579.1 hypothetical protein [Micromonospora tarapacensis]
MYDATEINARWGNQWPTDLSDASNHDHEHSPVLMAPVANLLGKPWYLEEGSPGGDFAIWLSIERGEHVGGRVGLCPFPALDGLMRWTIEVTDPAGNGVVKEHELLITEQPDTVAARARQFLTDHGIETPTQVAMATGFDYDGFQFSDAFPVPSAYVVAYGMALFRGPDGYLWFVPDNGKTGGYWGVPQNIAEFDRRNCDPDRPYNGPDYQAVMAEICRLVDAVTNADKAYRALPPPDGNPASPCWSGTLQPQTSTQSPG